MKRMGTLSIELEDAAVASIIHFLESFKVDFDTQLSWLDNIVRPSQYRNDFQKRRKFFLNIGNSSDNWSGLRGIDGGMGLYNLFSYRTDSINEYAKKIQLLSLRNNLWNSKMNIVLSVIHLHCNRLFGTIWNY